MAEAMSWSQTDLDTLEKAIVRGERVVQYADKRVEYRSLDEQLRARDLIRSELAAASGTPRKHGSYATFSKGL